MMRGRREAGIGLFLCVRHQDDVSQWVLPSLVLLVEYAPSLIYVLPVSDPFLFCNWKNIPCSFLRNMWPSESVNYF